MLAAIPTTNNNIKRVDVRQNAVVKSKAQLVQKTEKLIRNNDMPYRPDLVDKEPVNEQCAAYYLPCLTHVALSKMASLNYCIKSEKVFNWS